MDSSILVRIKDFQRDAGINDNLLSHKIGIPQTTVSGYMSGKRKIPLEFITSILDSYPDISAEWLLRGKGSISSTGCDLMKIAAPNGGVPTDGSDNNTSKTLNKVRLMLKGSGVSAEDANLILEELCQLL